jgi:putative lipoprotein
MRLSRPLCFALLPMLASCQVFTEKAEKPAANQVRLQGEISQKAGQLLFRPCKEQRQFQIDAPPESELSTDIHNLLNDGHSTLFADLRGQLQSATKTGLDGQIVPSEIYRLQAEGNGCNDINFSRTLLRASGNEPSWAVAVSNLGLILNRPGREPQALPYLEEQLPEGRLSLSSEANGQRLDLWVAKQRCVDAMSGAINHMTAELRLDGEVLRGCAYLGGARNK